MFNSEVLLQLQSEEAQGFVIKNLKGDPQKLRLKYHGKTDLPYTQCINQIEAKQRLRKKNPEWAENPKLLFPPKLNVEQSSSSQTAKYKANLLHGCRFIDLTGGMGIDSFYISKNFKVSHYAELNATLCQLAMYNFKVLAADVKVHNKNGFEVLEKSTEDFDAVYLDPARRIEGKRMVSLADCEPNILENLPLLFKKAKKVLVKTSPLLDIKKVTTELPHIKEIHVVSVNNDCKELLFLLNRDFNGEPNITTVNLTQPENQILISSVEGKNCAFADVREYLYEPNASVMKAGLFGEICAKYPIFKLHPNTHLFTSDKVIEGFPGKSFRVSDIFKPFKKSLKGEYVNVVSRNFNLKPEAIKKKAKTKDGGARYLFACTLKSERKVFILANPVD